MMLPRRPTRIALVIMADLAALLLLAAAGGQSGPDEAVTARPLEALAAGFSRIPHRTDRNLDNGSIAVLLRNPNTDLTAEGVEVQVRIFNNAGDEIVMASVGGTLMILPGEERPATRFIQQELPRAFDVDEVVVERIDVGRWVPTGPVPLLTVVNVQGLGRRCGDVFYENPFAVRGSCAAGWTGTLVNPLPIDLADVPVVALAFDETGRLLGDSSSLVPALPAGGSASIPSVHVYWLAPNRITKEVRLYPAYPWDDASMIRTAAQ